MPELIDLRFRSGRQESPLKRLLGDRDVKISRAAPSDLLPIRIVHIVRLNLQGNLVEHLLGLTLIQRRHGLEVSGVDLPSIQFAVNA